MTNQEIYKAWAKEQKAKAFEFYKDPFTGKMPDCNAIAYMHKTHIGGSTNSAILGVNRYNDINGAYNDMLTFSENKDAFALRRGHYLEKFVADEFSAITKLKNNYGVTLFDEKHNREWSMAQIDFLLDDDTPLEIKTATWNKDFDNNSKDFGKGCEFNDKGELITEDDLIPIEYYIQCQKQMYLADKPYMWLCVYIMTELKVRIFKIKRDDKTIQKILDSEDDFLFNHIIPQVPYKQEEVKTLEPVQEGDVDAVYTDETMNELLQQYKEKSALMSDLKKEQDNLSEKIKAMFGEHKEVIDAKGNVLAKLTTTITKRFNTTKFKAENAKLYKDYLTESKSQRLYVK